MAPDCTHWHGTCEVAKHWASEYILELKELRAQGKEAQSAAAEELEEKLLTEALNSDNHKWFIVKEDEAVRTFRTAFFCNQKPLYPAKAARSG